MEEVDKSGKLKLTGSQFNSSICYVPVDITESASYVQDIVHEMNIRNLSTSDKTVAQMREVIRSHLTAERKMRELIEFIDEEGNRADVMNRIMRYVPCVMHCENRCGIKINEMLLAEGLSNSQGDLITINESNNLDTINKRENAFVDKVQKYLNN